VLTINGNYTQASIGALNMDIGGATAGTQYDQLRISGTANLAGILNVTLINGYTPPHGTSFALLTYGSHTGTFGTINSGGGTFTPQYNSTDFSLLARADALDGSEEQGPPPGDEEGLPGRTRDAGPATALASAPPAAPAAGREEGVAAGLWGEDGPALPAAWSGSEEEGAAVGDAVFVALGDEGAEEEGWPEGPVAAADVLDLLALPVELLAELLGQLA
jgi:hypothetical protein